jgi:hypothetical protein
MSRDHVIILFIILVYCLVCEQYQVVIAQCPLRRRGFPPALTISQSHCLWQWNNKRFYRCSEYDEYHVSTQKMRN